MTKAILNWTLYLFFFFFMMACGGSSSTQVNPNLDPGSGGTGGISGVGGISETGGQGGSASSAEAIPFEITFCSDHEKLIGDWVDPASSPTDPHRTVISFGPIDGFNAFLPEIGSIWGMYQLIEGKKIEIAYVLSGRIIAGTSSPGLTMDGNHAVFSYVLSSNELQLTLQDETTYRFIHDETRSTISEIDNPFRNDGYCAESELQPSPQWVDHDACPQEMMNGKWHHVFPTFDHGFTSDVLEFSSTQPDVFTWSFFDLDGVCSSSTCVSDSNTRSLGRDSGNYKRFSINGTYSVTGSEIDFLPRGTVIPEIRDMMSKKYTLHFAPPFYIELQAQDGSNILLGRSVVDLRNHSIESYDSIDGVCEEPTLTGCPASSLLGTWRIDPFYNAIRLGKNIQLDGSSDVAPFDEMIFNPDGTLELRRDNGSSDDFLYQVLEFPANGSITASWTLILGRSTGDLYHSREDNNTVVPLLIAVSSGTLKIYFYYDSIAPIVFTKSSSLSGTVQCVVRQN